MSVYSLFESLYSDSEIHHEVVRLKVLDPPRMVDLYLDPCTDKIPLIEFCDFDEFYQQLNWFSHVGLILMWLYKDTIIRNNVLNDTDINPYDLYIIQWEVYSLRIPQAIEVALGTTTYVVDSISTPPMASREVMSPPGRRYISSLLSPIYLVEGHSWDDLMSILTILIPQVGGILLG